MVLLALDQWPLMPETDVWPYDINRGIRRLRFCMIMRVHGTTVKLCSLVEVSLN